MTNPTVMSDTPRTDNKIKSLLESMQLASDKPSEPAWRELRLARYAIQEQELTINTLERELLAAQSALKICGEALKGVAEFNRHNDDCYSQKTSPTTYSDPMASTCDCGLREAFIKYQESLSLPALKQEMEK